MYKSVQAFTQHLPIFSSSSGIHNSLALVLLLVLVLVLISGINMVYTLRIKTACGISR